MANRRSTLLFTGALVFSAAFVPASALAARPAQDPGATFGGGGTETTTTLPASTTVATTDTSDATNQTLVESEDSPDQPLFTENRKVAAVIGGLLFVAFAIFLLTIRYIRVTKPVARTTPADEPAAAPVAAPAAAELDDDSIFVTPAGEPAKVFPAVPDHTGDEAIEAPTSGATAIAAAPGADHAAADDDWQPRTGEHQRVDLAAGPPMARPGVAARRKTLGVDEG